MVATVTRLSEAASTVHYFEADGYYSKNDAEHRKASRWYGGGVTAIGLHGPVKPKRFEEVLSGRIPGTKTRLGRMREGQHEHRPGIDITFSAPKSISLEALVQAQPKTGAKIIRAHDEAVKATLDFIENELLETRGWDPATRKRPRVKAHGLVAATFRHYASRNLDPQLHTHAVVANMTQNSEGAWRSADFIKIERSKLLIGAFYRSELKQRIEALGYATKQTMVGSVPGFEIAGYTKEHLRAFSTRREEALRWAKERNLDASASVMQQAVLYTRKRKEEPSRSELARLWKQRTGELSLERDWHTARGRSAAARADLRDDHAATRLDRDRWNLRHRARQDEQQHPSPLFAVRRAVEHLEERRTVFSAAMLRALVLGSGRWSLPEIDGAITKLVADGHLIEARAHRSDRAFVTDRAVKAERSVLAWMKENRGVGGSGVPPGLLELALEDGPLNAGQKDAVRMLLLPGDRLVGVQGHAGTGKTTMLTKVVRQAGADRVVGLAPSSSAALTLGKETGLPTRTLQWLLTRYRDVGDGTADADTLAKAREALAGRILVVDEASLISMNQMDALLRIAGATDVARVALVGDRRQLRAVEAGQPFRVLQDAGMPTAVMDEVLRQRDMGLKAAVLQMIEGKPGLALDTLGPGVLEMPADELGDHAAALWLDLDARAREGTRILAPTHARRREINRSVREGLKAEGSLRGRTLEIERYVNLHLTRSQKGEIDNWHEGDMVVFHHDVYGARARKGDACRITGLDGDRVLFDHPDGKPRKGDPSGYLRYHVDLFETDRIEVQAGDRIRWTRNDRERSLLNGEEARIVSIGHRNLRLCTADGRDLVMAHDDPQLHFIDHAWSSTVHAAQGITCDQVIAVLDADHGSLGGQAAFYVEMTRARDNAVLLTDDRDALVEALETATGDELSALEAIGGQFREEEETQADILPKPALADDALEGVRRTSKGLEKIHALEPHLVRCLEERHRLEDAAGDAPLFHTDGYAAWRERTTAALDIGREAAGGIDFTKTAETLRGLLAFDADVLGLEEELRRHVAQAGEQGEDLVPQPGFKELVQLVLVVDAEAPPYARMPAALAELPALYESVTGAEAEELLYGDEAGEEESQAAVDVAASPSGETPEMPAADHGSAEAPAEKPATSTDRPSPEDIANRLAAAIEERRALIAEADGRLIPSLDSCAGWRKRAEAAVDAWQRFDGAHDDAVDRDAARLGRAFAFDDRAAELVARLEAHEAEARAAERDPMAGLHAARLALACVSSTASRVIDGEPIPRVLADFGERHQAWWAERKKQEAQPAPGTDVEKVQPETAGRPAPEPGPTAVAPPRKPATPAPKPAVRPPPPRQAEPAAVPSRPAAPPPPAPELAPKTRATPRSVPAGPSPAAPEPAPKQAPPRTRSPAPRPTVAPPSRKPATPAPKPAVRPVPARQAEPAVASSPPAAPSPPPEPDPAVAAHAIALALQQRRHLQQGSAGQPLAALAAWETWRRETEVAITDWKASKDNPAGGRTWRDVHRLEALIAFDTEASTLAGQWRRHADDVGRTDGDPFDHPDTGRILSAIRRLKDQAPQDAVLPQALARTLEEADGHVLARERVETLLASVSALDRDRRVLLEREGSRDRPLNRRWNRRWKRWQKEAQALAPVIEELKSPTLAGHLDGIAGARALVSRVEGTIAGSEKRDTFPGWLLLRLHDNAAEADRQGIHATQTSAWKELISKMTALSRRLEADDPRWRLLWQETYAEDKRNETKAEVKRLEGEIDHFHRRAASLATEAGKEGLPIHQSAAYAYWHSQTRHWSGQVRRILGREGAYGEVLADGSTTAHDMDEAVAAFEEIRKAHGPPDGSVRMERRREEQEQETQKLSQSRGRGFSM